MFDSLKKSLGLSKSRQASNSKGHVLGTGKTVDSEAANTYPKDPVISSGSQQQNYEIFDREFCYDKLGMSVQEWKNILPIDDPSATTPSRAQVVDTSPGSEASKLGIEPNDIIISLNGAHLQDFKDFQAVIVAVERPVLIKFFRFKRTKDKSGDMNQPSKGLSFASVFKPFSGNASQAPPVVSEAEKQTRREVMTKAANERSQAWEKRIGSGSSKNNRARNPEEPLEYQLPDTNTSNPETLRVIQKTKELEVNVEKALGYSPFQPHMSFSGNKSGSLSPSNPVSTPTVVRGVVEEDEYMVAEVDDAFAMLLSLADCDQERAQVAVQTVQKMLLNLFNNKADPKFRTINLTNKTFQSKVVSVSGGVELLLAAGYRHELGEDSGKGSFNTETESPMEYREGSLVHDMNPISSRKLHYTVSRLQELLDMQQSK